ncbi:hypothetical protein [Mycobacterium mantenii]|uniref:hypothetical protein n=1 Tax=Mycobacterium mantenii TaxID=560555 RepID=UPI001E41F73E|nr:hypothetical protein [Mycobacterium mantenii]
MSSFLGRTGPTDLLTKDEARERLVEEIERTHARLDEVTASSGDPAQIDAEITPLARRLNAMESVPRRIQRLSRRLVRPNPRSE